MGLIEDAIQHREEARARKAGLVRRLSFAQYLWLWNKLMGLTTPGLHRRIAGWLEGEARGGDARLLLQVFRDAGKSSLVGLYCAWRLSRNADLRVLIVAAEHELASKMARHVAEILRAHPLSSEIATASGGKAAESRFFLRRNAILRDPSVMAKGLYANLTGARADLIVLDDIEVPNTADTAAKRARLRRRIKEFGFILAPKGDLIAVGTPHAFDSIYRPDPPGGGDAVFDGFARLTLPILDANGRSAWPERFDRTAIARLKRDSGPSAFRSQMLLEPIDPKKPRFDPVSLIRYDAPLRVVDHGPGKGFFLGDRRMRDAAAAWDPSFGAADRGDASVLAVTFIDEEGGYWLHDLCYLAHDPKKTAETDEATQLCRAAADALARNHIRRVFVENNGIGKFLPGLLRKELRARRSPIAVVEHTAKSRKETRILSAIEPLLAAGALRAHARVFQTPLLDEMRQWAPESAGRDDGLDAIAASIAHLPPRFASAGAEGGGRVFRADADFSL